MIMQSALIMQTPVIKQIRLVMRLAAFTQSWRSWPPASIGQGVSIK